MPNFAAYCAGLFDGEGMVGIHYNKYTEHSCIHVEITNTHKGVLDLISARFGGTVYKMVMGDVKFKKQPYRLMFHKSDEALRFLSAIHRHSVIKKDQIEVAFEFIEFKTESERTEKIEGKGKGQKILKHSVVKQELEYRNRLKQLKTT